MKQTLQILKEAVLQLHQKDLFVVLSQAVKKAFHALITYFNIFALMWPKIIETRRFLQRNWMRYLENGDTFQIHSNKERQKERIRRNPQEKSQS